MPIDVKPWENLPSTDTPISAAALSDLEARMGAYADTVGGSGTDPNAVPKSLYAANGTMVTGGLSAGAPVATALGPNGSRPKVNTLTPGGFTFDIGMQVFNVQDYGATGLAATPDQGAAINDCLSAAASAGGIAFFPAGVYMVASTNQIDVPSNSHLLGAGVGKSILRAAAGSANFNVLRSVNLGTQTFTNITLENLEIDGNRANRTGSGDLVTFRGIEATGVRSSGFRMIGCYLHDAPGFTLINKYCDNLQILGNRIYNGGRDGISMGPGIDRIIVANNIVRETADDGIAVGGRQGAYITTNAIVANNVIDGAGMNPAVGGHGIAMTGTTGGVISGNVINRAQNAAIMLCNGGDGQCKRISITGNTLQNAGSTYTAGLIPGHGIHLFVSAVGGYSENAPLVGTDFGHEAYVGSIVIDGNVIANPHSHAILVEGTVPNPIRDVDIRDNRLIGLLASDGTPYTIASGIHAPRGAQQFNVSGNAINGFTGRGIYVGNSSTTPTNWTINNNQVLSNGRGPTEHAGIQLVAVTGMVMNNRSTDNGVGTQTYGFNWGGSNVFLAHNDFSGNVTAATTGTKSGVERMNRRNDGTLMIGDAGTAGNV